MSKFLQPFGPLVYRNDISEEFHSFLLDGLGHSKKNGDDMRDKLAGNIQVQTEGLYDPVKFMQYINPHVADYCREIDKEDFLIKKHDPKWSSPYSYDLDLEVIYDLGGGPWINFQRKHEFNPTHNHNGEISAIIFIDIPKEIEEHRLESQKNYPSDVSGLLEFSSAGQNWLVSPKSKEIMLFDAGLKHSVYPFSLDLERITMSFNLFNLDKRYY